MAVQIKPAPTQEGCPRRERDFSRGDAWEGSNAVARRAWFALLLCVIFLPAPGRAQKESPAADQRAVLQQILTQSYQPSIIGKHLMGVGSATEIRRAGEVIVVQRPGLFASWDRNETASTAIRGLDANVYRGNKDYGVPVGERFYVFSISVGSDVVTFGLLSARSITVPQGTGRVWAVVSLFFPPETLANAEKDVVFRAIDAWFVPEGRSMSSPPPSSPSPSPPPAAQVPEAPAPGQPAQAGQPANLAPGMTRDQIVSALGPPQREMSFEARTWLNYPGVVLVLEGGKLASVEELGQPSANVAVHSDPAGAEIYLDGQLVGSTPSVINIPPGNHQLSIRLSGFPEWLRSLHVLAGSEINLQANLEKK